MTIKVYFSSVSIYCLSIDNLYIYVFQASLLSAEKSME